MVGDRGGLAEVCLLGRDGCGCQDHRGTWRRFGFWHVIMPKSKDGKKFHTTHLTRGALAFWRPGIIDYGARMIDYSTTIFHAQETTGRAIHVVKELESMIVHSSPSIPVKELESIIVHSSSSIPAKKLECMIVHPSSSTPRKELEFMIIHASSSIPATKQNP